MPYPGLWAIVLAIGLALPLRAAAQTEIREEVYGWVMSQVREYEGLNEPKVMAICIEWRSAAGTIKIHNAFAHYTGVTSDGPTFVNSLAQSALHSCRQWRKSEEIDCDCTMLDKNGQNVLKAPR